MIKHFCDICGLELSVHNTALRKAMLIQRDFDGMNHPVYLNVGDLEICDDCAHTLCNVMDALKNGKEVKYK